MITIKNNNFKKTNSSFFNLAFFHNSSIIYSESNTNSEVQILIDNALNLSEERVNNLQLIQYNKEIKSEELESISPVSEYKESFPWFIDENGKDIDFNGSINVFNSVKLIKLISQFLEKRYDVNKDSISNVKISELLEPFKDGNNITVLELFNHVGEIYNKNKNSLVKDVIFDTGNNEAVASLVNLNNLRPFGIYGQKTLNELSVDLLNLKWELLIKGAKVTVHAVPLAINLISFTFILKSYMKYVHNRPFPSHYNPIQIESERLIRRRQLGIFTILGAPLALLVIKNSGPFIKDVINIDLIGGSPDNNKNINNNMISNSGFLLVLSKISNKIPNWVKLSFKILFFIILVLKLLGYSLITDVINDVSFLSKFVYVYASVVITYQLLSLYLIHKFSTKNVKISEVLPDFMINWLKEFEVMASTKEGIKGFKKNCYIEISIYLTIVIVTIIFL